MRHEESRLQKAVVRVLHLKGFVVFANANGGYRRPVEAAILKGMGVLAGVPDLTVLLPNGHALWIELKTPDNKSKLSPAQKAWHEQAELFGHAVVTCRSVEEACDEAQKAWAYAFSKEWLVRSELANH